MTEEEFYQLKAGDKVLLRLETFPDTFHVVEEIIMSPTGGRYLLTIASSGDPRPRSWSDRLSCDNCARLTRIV
jgi:hypothetical protein